ncbi:hypothetical protein D3C75_900450 [compost metagenome]
MKTSAECVLNPALLLQLMALIASGMIFPAVPAVCAAHPFHCGGIPAGTGSLPRRQINVQLQQAIIYVDQNPVFEFYLYGNFAVSSHDLPPIMRFEPCRRQIPGPALKV